MGRKRSGSGQHLYLCIACIILLLFSGCAALEERHLRQTADNYLVRSMEHLQEGNYEEALRENRKVLSLFVKGPPGDEALFNIGLIYAHYNNPEKDYKKSIGYFQTLIKEYPLSPLIEQAEMWSRILAQVSNPITPDVELNEPEEKENYQPDTNENYLTDTEEYLVRGWQYLQKGDYNGALKEINKVLSSSTKEAPFDKALFNIGLIYAHYDNPDKDYKKSIYYFMTLIGKYPDSPFAEQAKIWVNVLNVIEKAQQVDIEIDEKKKELTR